MKTILSCENYSPTFSFAGDTKPGHPVTRTGSDRRPDAVREESRTHDGHNNAHDNEDDSSHADRYVICNC